MYYDKINNDVAFVEADHKYFNVKYPDLKYTSVTTLIGKYHEKFDSHFFSRYKTFEKLCDPNIFGSLKSKMLFLKVWKDEYLEVAGINKEIFDVEVERLLLEWKLTNEEACTIGTQYHLEKENQWYSKANEMVKEKLAVEGEFQCIKHDFSLTAEKAVIPEYLIYYSCKEQLLNLAGQVDLLIKDGNDIYILDYKGLPLDTPILTTNGFKLLKNITKEDVIFDKEGRETNIKGVSEIHYNPCYEIHFDNNESIIADHEHRWLIHFRRLKNEYFSKVMTTLELKEWMESKTRTSYNTPKILNAKPLKTKVIDLPIDPYVLGAWLGDGSKASGVITNVNPDFWKEIAKRGFEVSLDLNRNQDRCEMRTVYDLSPELRKLGLLNNKHLPDDYLLSSYEQRLDLLRGLMDTDGYYHKKRKRFVMTTTQQWQIEATVKIVSSLGSKTTVIPCIKDCNGKKVQGWDVCFHMNDNPFLIRNQYNLPKPKLEKASFRNIVKIISVDTIPTKCLEVDSESHTFLAGKSLLVTHNTNAKGIKDKAYYNPKIGKTKRMFFPINNIEDTTLNHYTIQLSLYAWMLQKINPEFNIKLLKLLHIDRAGVETEYEVPYLKDDVTRLLKYHKKILRDEEFKNDNKITYNLY